MPLRRTKRSDGQHRPRWKDGSHAKVENTDAEQSRCNGFAFQPNLANEPLEKVQSLLELNDEQNVSTRDRPARTGADARIEESAANGGVRLALQPYGKRFKPRFPHHRIRGALTSRPPSGATRPLPGFFYKDSGAIPAVTESDILEPSEVFRKSMDYFSHSTKASGLLEKLAKEEPNTLACMHGSAWKGDGASLLRELGKSLFK